jgi:hypothetical protein
MITLVHRSGVVWGAATRAAEAARRAKAFFPVIVRRSFQSGRRARISAHGWVLSAVVGSITDVAAQSCARRTPPLPYRICDVGLVRPRRKVRLKELFGLRAR